METKQPGWLMPYLLQGDLLWTNRRWAYWMETLYQERVLPYPIPTIQFAQQVPREGERHLQKLCEGLMAWGLDPRRSLEVIVDWLLYGFGDPSVPEWRDIGREICYNDRSAWDVLYRDLKLGIWQKEPYDYFGHHFETTITGRWNPNAIFLTPMSLCSAMNTLTFGGEPVPAQKSQKVCDPCCGSGRFLLWASNHSLRLYAQDVSELMVKLTKINGYLYMPWLVRTSERINWEVIKPLPIITAPPRRKHQANSDGQFLLFEFE